MIAFIDDHRATYGVAPICRELPIAPSSYRAHAARRADPSKAPPRVRRDTALRGEIRRVWEANFRVYGVRKVWRQLGREGIGVARCTVARIVRGKSVRTTISDKAAPCPLDRVKRDFKAPAPNRLWVSDFTYVATWTGVVYVVFVIDAYARRIVGWRVSQSAEASFVLDALEQAIHARRPARAGLIHHSDRGSQYLSLRYTERLGDAWLLILLVMQLRIEQLQKSVELPHWCRKVKWTQATSVAAATASTGDRRRVSSVWHAASATQPIAIDCRFRSLVAPIAHNANPFRQYR